MGIYTDGIIFYKVVGGVAIRLKSGKDIDYYKNINNNNINDAVYKTNNDGYDIITKHPDHNTIGDTLRSMGFNIITFGGKKSRKNKKHKKKSATKRRTARKHAY